MRQALIVTMAFLFTSTARAEVPRRTFKALGDVAYLPREGEASCGKASRDMIRDMVKAAKTVTVTASQLRMNNGDGLTIAKEEGDAVYAFKSWPAPTETHPHRVISIVMALLVMGDDATFMMARTAESDGQTCTDVYRVSIE